MIAAPTNLVHPRVLEITLAFPQGCTNTESAPDLAATVSTTARIHRDVRNLSGSVVETNPPL